MPFRFLEEIATADVAFEAWGNSREELFSASAAALLNTMTAAPEEVARHEEVAILLKHDELELLLFSFLEELIFLKDARRLLLHADTVRIAVLEGTYHLEATVKGERIDTVRHCLLVDVKAVTLHLLQVTYEDSVWKAVVVLDV